MFTPYTPNFQSLMLMLDAAHMGWWKANFQTGELYVSEYIARLLGLDGDKIRIGQLTHLIREDYRMPIHNEFMALKVGSKFDRTFPVELPEGEVWLHAQLVGRQTDPDTGTHLFGYMQRVPVHDRREAEILTLENNYHTVVKENKHMDVLLDHLPIGYFRIRLLYDSDGRAIDYLFLSVNRAAQQIVGIAPDAYTDKTAREAGLPVDAHIDKLAHIRIGDYKVCEWFAEKTRRHCRSFLYNTPNDETELVILTLDITDAVTAHKALDEQEKLLRNIIQNAPVGIEIYNHRGRLIDINTCDLEMFGVKDPGKIRGLNLFDNPNFPEETKIRI
jgi:PAS domain-containing protein